MFVVSRSLWILRTGAPWKDLPERYPPYQTVRRRFRQWAGSGAFEAVFRALACGPKQRGGVDLSKCSIDGTFIAAKGGTAEPERPGGARAANSWRWRGRSWSSRRH
ncbi:MAG: transposase [Bacteroidetes bacterium]|nr:transposase [Bacteroidota bacterium]